jgi:hypothetical protein
MLMVMVTGLWSAGGDDPIKKSPYFQTTKTYTKHTRNGLKFDYVIKLILNYI